MSIEALFIQEAIAIAAQSATEGGFPAGAVVVVGGEVVARGKSLGWKINDPTSHGEVAAIREACHNLDVNQLTDATLYTSLEPCLMCLGAICWSGIQKVVYASSKERVSQEWYAGNYHTHDINHSLINPINFIHAKDYEEKSLQIIFEWEKRRTAS